MIQIRACDVCPERDCENCHLTSFGDEDVEKEDARIYKRLNAYDLDEDIGDLIAAIDEELYDEESDFEEEDEDE